MNIIASKDIAQKEVDLSILKGGIKEKPVAKADQPNESRRGRRRNGQARRGGRGRFQGYGPRYRGQRFYPPPWYYQNRRPRGPPRMQGRPMTAKQRDLQDIIQARQTAKLEGEKAKRFDEITAVLFNHDAKKLNRPPTAFQLFVDEKRKDNPKMPIKDIQAEWDKHPEKELRREKSWNAFQEFLAELRAHNKKRLELVNEMHVLVDKPVIQPREPFVKGFDLFWKDVEAKVKEEHPKATAYELQKKRQDMWRGLNANQKRCYVLQSMVEREKVAHARRMAGIERRIQVAKAALNGPEVAAKSA